MPPAAIPWIAYATLALSMCIVGSYVGLSKLLVAIFPVFLLAWLRFGIAAVAMLPWLRREGGELPLSTHDRRLLFWESFLGNFGFSICMLYGVMLTSAVSAGVVMAAIPAATALLSRVFLGERISARVAAGILCAVSGIVLLALAKDSASTGSAAPSGQRAAALGHLLLVAAAFCEASYIVIGKRLTSNVSPRRISALINVWGLALVTPLGAWQAMNFDFTSVRAPMWALLLFYSLAASVLTVWLWMRGLRRVPAARAGVFSVMLPVSAALVGVAALGEPFGAMHAVAFVLAIAGLILATWPASGPMSKNGHAR
jgi:drug/metabolite transporter (DMT)-like permease